MHTTLSHPPPHPPHLLTSSCKSSFEKGGVEATPPIASPHLDKSLFSGIIMADVKVDDALKKEIEAGKKLAAVGAPETGVNAHDATLAGISNFKTDKLKTTTTAEKQVLPSAEDIAAEKAEAS